MTKEEFEKIVRKHGGDTSLLTNTEFKDIETVYAFHPSISKTEGKEQIAYLYSNFGMRIIKDMLPTAYEYSGF